MMNFLASLIIILAFFALCDIVYAFVKFVRRCIYIRKLRKSGSGLDGVVSGQDPHVRDLIDEDPNMSALLADLQKVLKNKGVRK